MVRGLMPSSDHVGYQACTWYTDLPAGKTLMNMKSTLGKKFMPELRI